MADDKMYQKLVSSPLFVSQKKFSKNLVTVCKMKKVMTHNEPVCLGVCRFKF